LQLYLVCRIDDFIFAGQPLNCEIIDIEETDENLIEIIDVIFRQLCLANYFFIELASRLELIHLFIKKELLISLHCIGVIVESIGKQMIYPLDGEVIHNGKLNSD